MECHSAENGPLYLGQLIALFKYISHNKTVQSQHTELRGSGLMYFNMLSAYKKRRFKTWSLDIKPNIEIKVNNKKYCGINGETSIHIGGVINVKNNVLINQSLVLSIVFTATDGFTESDLESYACCHIKANIPEVIRRFHFDIDTNLKNARNPLSHLQYGGDFSSDHLSVSNDAQYNLFKAVDLPRIPIPPYDIVLILDLILNQFNTNIEFLHSSEPVVWLNLVKDSEILCFCEYHKEIVSHLDDSSKTNSIYMHMCNL